MATTKIPAAKAPPQQTAETAPTAPEALGEGQDEASTAETPQEPEARRHPPLPPTGALPRQDYVVVEQIRGALQQAVFSRHPEAAAAAIQTVEAIATVKTHRQVSAYKAEALDFLRGKAKAAQQ